MFDGSYLLLPCELLSHSTNCPAMTPATSTLPLLGGEPQPSFGQAVTTALKTATLKGAGSPAQIPGRGSAGFQRGEMGDQTSQGWQG